MEPRTFIIMNVKTNAPVLDTATGLPLEFERVSEANVIARKLASEEYARLGLGRSWVTYGFMWQQGFTNAHFVVKPKIVEEEG